MERYYLPAASAIQLATFLEYAEKRGPPVPLIHENFINIFQNDPVKITINDLKDIFLEQDQSIIYPSTCSNLMAGNYNPAHLYCNALIRCFKNSCHINDEFKSINNNCMEYLIADSNDTTQPAKIIQQPRITCSQFIFYIMLLYNNTDSGKKLFQLFGAFLAAHGIDLLKFKVLKPPNEAPPAYYDSLEKFYTRGLELEIANKLMTKPNDALFSILGEILPVREMYKQLINKSFRVTRKFVRAGSVPPITLVVYPNYMLVYLFQQEFSVTNFFSTVVELPNTIRISDLTSTPMGPNCWKIACSLRINLQDSFNHIRGRSGFKIDKQICSTTFEEIAMPDKCFLSTSTSTTTTNTNQLVAIGHVLGAWVKVQTDFRVPYLVTTHFSTGCMNTYDSNLTWLKFNIILPQVLYSSMYTEYKADWVLLFYFGVYTLALKKRMNEFNKTTSLRHENIIKAFLNLHHYCDATVEHKDISGDVKYWVYLEHIANLNASDMEVTDMFEYYYGSMWVKFGRMSIKKPSIKLIWASPAIIFHIEFTIKYAKFIAQNKTFYVVKFEQLIMNQFDTNTSQIVQIGGKHLIHFTPTTSSSINNYCKINSVTPTSNYAIFDGKIFNGSISMNNINIANIEITMN